MEVTVPAVSLPAELPSPNAQRAERQRALAAERSSLEMVLPEKQCNAMEEKEGGRGGQ